MRAAQAGEGFALLCLQHLRLCREAGRQGAQVDKAGLPARGPEALPSGQGALSL